MKRFKVVAELTYYVNLEDEDAVYEHADDLWISEVEASEVYVSQVVEVKQ